MEIGRHGLGPNLLYRENFDPQLLRAAVLSLGVHVLFALVIVVWSMVGARGREFKPPVYVVGLISPKPGSAVYSVGPLAKKPAPEPAAKPKPVEKAPPKPVPVAKPVEKAPPKPVPVAKPVEKAPPKPVPVAKPVEKAPPKPAPEPKPVPVAKPVEKVPPKPAPEPEPVKPATSLASASGGKASPAVSTAAAGLQSGPAGAPGGQPKTLAYVRYYNELHDTLKSHFVWAGRNDENLAATVRFSILPDGRVTDVRMTSGSGDPHYDRAVINAVRGIVRLTPPPAQHQRDFKEVEWVFRPAGS